MCDCKEPKPWDRGPWEELIDDLYVQISLLQMRLQALESKNITDYQTITVSDNKLELRTSSSNSSTPDNTIIGSEVCLHHEFFQEEGTMFEHCMKCGFTRVRGYIPY